MAPDKKIKFLITVDTETYYKDGRLLPFDTNVYGKINGSQYGVAKIMELCDNYNVKATFFVDVYEHYKFGKSALKELCRKIFDSGHSVQLHAHTNFIPGSHQGLIKSFDFSAQKEIISEGKSLIEDWTGRPPVAFRAGVYGANLETIRALEENKFLIDSSYFAFNKNCALSNELNNAYTNRPFMINNILEIPVTVYNLFNLFFWKKNSKIDLNACSFAEINNVVRKITGSGKRLNTVIIFLHSFSFIRWDRSSSEASVDHRAIDRFNALLDLLITKYKQEEEFIRMEEIDGAYIDGIRQASSLADYVPQIYLPYLVPRLLKRFQ